VKIALLGVVSAALVLAGCGLFRQRPLTVEAPRSPAGATQGAAAPTGIDTPEPPKLAGQLSRVAGELSELQNAVAKLMASLRQQQDQLAYLQRRVAELETQTKSRAPSVPGGFAPPAPIVAPTPPQLGSATTTPAEDLYRVGVEKLQAKELDAAVLIFYDLIGTYADHPLRESAQLLVADILYQQKDYRGALTELEALIRAVPRGEKVPDALLKIGFCQRSLGDGVLAKRTWQRLVRDYPSSVAARQARVLLKS
jgi:TolA-binding protein